jgi:hypothetical protein
MHWTRYIILAICIWTSRLCSAAFQGFPLADGTNTSWYAINAQYAPISQIYSGIVERCEVTGVAEPSWTQTLYIDSSATGTVEELVVTNAIGPVAYTNAYTNGLAYPVVSHTMLAELDDTIDALIPEFASTNIYLYPDAAGGAYTRQMLFGELGIGLVSTNVATVGTNQVTNTVARWTRSPERRWTENLVEMHHAGTNGWQLMAAEAVEWWDPASTNAAAASVSVVTGAPLPYVAYGPTTTTWSVSLAGLDLYGSNRTETVAAGSECTVPWHSITGTPVISGYDGSVTGAWFTVQYTNNITVYGDRPYRLYAADLDERAAVLAALTRTVVVQAGYSNDYVDAWSSVGTRSDWDVAKAEAEDEWVDVLTVPPGYVTFMNGHFFKNTLSQLSSSSKRARLNGGFFKPYLRGVSTNIPRSVSFMAYLEPDVDAIEEEPGTYTYVTVFDDFGSGYTTNVWNTIWSGLAADQPDIDCPDWFPFSPGTQPLPWYGTNPASNDVVHTKTLGSVPNYGVKALIDWQFQYR